MQWGLQDPNSALLLRRVVQFCRDVRSVCECMQPLTLLTRPSTGGSGPVYKLKQYRIGKCKRSSEL